jgi:CubicO group peptidase (beta-lactamase class C family)
MVMEDTLTYSNSFNPKLRDFGRPIGFDVFHADVRDIIKMPLVNQPGSKWEYGINIDWAGIVLERATGSRLNDLIQKGIIEPLGLKNVTMLPTDEMKKNLATMHQRWPGDTTSTASPSSPRRPRKRINSSTVAEQAVSPSRRSTCRFWLRCSTTARAPRMVHRS